MAWPEFEKALKLNSTLSEPHCGLGLAYVALNRTADALNHAHAALEIDRFAVPITLYRTALIYSKAAALTNDIEIVRHHLNFAQELLVKASDLLSINDRALLWQKIDRDPGLRALKRRLGYADWYRKHSSNVLAVPGAASSVHSSWERPDAAPVAPSIPAATSPVPRGQPVAAPDDDEPPF
jgi:hypothetical protein